MTIREWFHLAHELDEPVSPALFRAAFPSPRSSRFALEGGGSEKLDRLAFLGAEPVASFRASRTRFKQGAGGPLARDALGRATACVVIDDLAQPFAVVDVGVYRIGKLYPK